MKKYMIFLLSFFLWNCAEDELPLYNGKTCIYFSNPDPSNPLRYTSEMHFSFGLLNVMDSVIRIPVTGSGDTVSYDRHFSFVIDSISGGKEGVHFDPLPEKGIFPGGAANGYIPVRLHRVLDDNEIYHIYFRLVSDDEFEVNIPESYWGQDTTDLTRMKLTFSSAITKPQYWMDAFFGYFSLAKYNLCYELMGLDANFWTTRPTNPNLFVSYGNILQTYIESKILEGVDVALADPQNKEEKGYMTMRKKRGARTIPADWPEADKR